MLLFSPFRKLCDFASFFCLCLFIQWQKYVFLWMNIIPYECTQTVSRSSPLPWVTVNWLCASSSAHKPRDVIAQSLPQSVCSTGACDSGKSHPDIANPHKAKKKNQFKVWSYYRNTWNRLFMTLSRLAVQTKSQLLKTL